jgi:ferredoxin-type protein NapH
MIVLILKRNRFLIARRITQVMVIFFFLAGSAWGWKVLKGNLSSASVFDVIPLSDPYHVMQMFAALTIPANDALVGALIILAFYGIVAGRAFCGWICPMNIITDAANWLRGKLMIEGGTDINRNARYWVLGLSVILSLILGVAAFEWISPISMLHRGIIFGMGFGWLAVMSVFLLDFLFVKNGFCGHFCPLGGFYALTGRFSLLRPKYIHEKCSMCRKCFEVCTENQVLAMVGRESGLVVSGECLNCGRCIDVCSDDALKFSNRFDRKY